LKRTARARKQMDLNIYVTTGTGTSQEDKKTKKKNKLLSTIFQQQEMCREITVATGTATSRIFRLYPRFKNGVR